ncbi:MAG: BatD family protein [Phycisphaerales bacterium]
MTRPPSIPTLILAALAAVLGLLLPAAPALAQGSPGVAAKVSANRVALGDSLTLQILVEGASSVPPPDLSTLDGFTIRPGGVAHGMNIAGGQVVETATLSWQLTPTRKGVLTIPAITVTVRGRAYTTEPIEIAVVEPSESPDFRLTLEADRTTVYVGEPVKVRLVWHVGKQVRTVQFTGNDGGDDFDIALGPDPRPGGAGGRDDQRYPQFKFLGLDAVGRLGQGDLDGVQVTTLTLDLIITPRRAGEVRVGPINAIFQAVTGQRPRNFFDAPWDDTSTLERRVLAATPLTLDVLPLPDEGKPAGFTGLIGEFGITSSAGSGQASVGDPIPLTVRITGPEPLEAEAPDLSTAPGFDAFKLAPEGWQPAGSRAGERAFTTTLRPRSDSVTEIPPVALSYFDTAKCRYETARSSAIPLKVLPTREVTAADAIGARVGRLSEPTSSAPAGKPLIPGPGGIHANYEGDDALIDQEVSLIEWAGHPVGALVLAGPPALCLAVSLARGRRAGETASARRRRALARSRRLLRRARTEGEIADALRVYLGGALGAEPAAITSADARSMLTAAGSTLGDKAAALLAGCERARFGANPDAIAGAPPRSPEALDLLTRLHSELERLS